jgi:hypothetical protein
MISLAGVLISCQKSFSIEDEQEYQKGYQYGEKIAKQDAIDHACTGSMDNPSSNIWFQQRKYLKNLKETHSKKFIKGFLHGYEYSFRDHMDIYCNGSERSRPEKERFFK